MIRPIALAALAAIGLSACQLSGGAGYATFRSEAPVPVSMASIAGTYDGRLPCADCSGLRTVLTLGADGRYRMEESYEGKPAKPIATRGSYRLDAARGVVTLDRAAGGRSVQVAGDRAYVLAPDGKRFADVPFPDAFILFRAY